jgi:protein-S-isoprenylcysteine O-methyltransferase Ste14
MPRTALTLDLGFLLLAVGWRSWIQYRRTGDTGFRGRLRAAEPLEKVAGVLLLAGVVGLLVSPICAMVGRVPSLAVLDRADVRALGIVLACSGIGLTVLAELQMGDSWRVGVDPSETTSLVAHGLFGYIRNPIYGGILLYASGLFCLVPSLVSAAADLVLVLGIQIQVRGVEEPYLARRHGQTYRDYARIAGRFIPWVGRLA